MMEKHPVPSPSLWGAYMGHGGDTYGFLSEQGIIGQLGNASFSVVSNEDTDGRFVQAALHTPNAPTQAVSGTDAHWACSGSGYLRAL